MSRDASFRRPRASKIVAMLRSRSTRGWLALAMAMAAYGTFGCSAVQRAAAKDPQRCERDPNCADTRYGKPNDCSTQCADDRACMERCQQINFSR